MTAAAIDRYLGRVRDALRALPEADRDDIVHELRTHIEDVSAGDARGVDAALASLGDPTELARHYETERRAVRAECSGSPLTILHGLRHASRTRLGRVTATALYAFAYINVFALWAAAIDKLFAPTSVGAWRTPGDLWPIRLVTAGEPPPHSHELLGWWLVPLAVLAGWLVRVAADRLAQAWLARFRRSEHVGV